MQSDKIKYGITKFLTALPLCRLVVRFLYFACNILGDCVTLYNIRNIPLYTEGIIWQIPGARWKNGAIYGTVPDGVW